VPESKIPINGTKPKMIASAVINGIPTVDANGRPKLRVELQRDLRQLKEERGDEIEKYEVKIN